MAWPAHLHISFGGPFWTDDIWSMNLTYARDANPGGDGLATLPTTEGEAVLWTKDHVDEIATVVKNWWTGGCGASTQALLTWCKAVIVVRDPADSTKKKYSAGHSFTPMYVWGSGQVPGAKGTITLAAPPPQVACAISWKSDKPRGVGANGRVFLPSGIFQMNAGTPYINSSTATDVLGAFVDMIEAMNAQTSSMTTDGGSNLAHCIVTPGSAKTGEAGRAESVTKYRLGRRHDVIRSRANKLSEQWVEQDV